jgi:hypothetical protein
MSGLAVVGLQASRSDIGIVTLQRADMSIFLQITEGLDGGLVLRGADDVIPFRTGQRPLLRPGDTRPIVLSGWVQDTEGSPLTAYRNAMDDLLTIFAESPEALVLIATLEDGTTRWIQTWHPNVLAPQQDALPLGIKQVSVEVTALDPYWYGQWGGLRLDTNWTFDQGATFDSSSVLNIYPAGLAYDKAINVGGTADTEKVLLAFTGPSSVAPGIMVVETGVGFELAAPLIAGESLSVNNDARFCTLAGVNARGSMTLNASNRHGEYLRLPPDRCTLRITGAPQAVSLIFTPTYR